MDMNIEKKSLLSLPDLALLAGTRGLLGAGLALLLGDHLTADQRRSVGWTLVTVGAVSTIPLAFEVLGSRQDHKALAEPYVTH
jgi:hypothetical protein